MESLLWMYTLEGIANDGEVLESAPKLRSHHYTVSEIIEKESRIMQMKGKLPVQVCSTAVRFSHVKEVEWTSNRE